MSTLIRKVPRSEYLDGKLINSEPVFLVNGTEESVDYKIIQGDEISIINPITIGEVKKYILKKKLEIN